jgi:putative membrane protein
VIVIVLSSAALTPGSAGCTLRGVVSEVAAFLLDPPVWLAILAAVLYRRGRWRRLTVAGAEPTSTVTTGRAAAFFVGLAVIVAALTGPVDRYSDTLFWVHMTQHVLLAMVAAPLIVIGAPWMPVWRPIPLRIRRAVARGLWVEPWSAGLRRRIAWLALPWPAFVAFNANLLVWHLPALYDRTLRYEALHYLEHGLLLATAIVFWSQIVPSPPFEPRLRGFWRIGYLTAAQVPSWLLAVTLAFWPSPLYSHYVHVADRPTGISALADQQLAAGVMWVPASLPIALAIYLAVYSWLGEDDAPPRRRRAAGSRP